MSSRQTLADQVILPVCIGNREASPNDGQTIVHEEDGWIFSERPGMGVTCIGRSSPLPEPYPIRHSFPNLG